MTERGSARARLLMHGAWYTKVVYHTHPSGVIRSVIPFRMLRRLLRTLLGIPAPLDGATPSSPVVRRDDELWLRVEKLQSDLGVTSLDLYKRVEKLDREEATRAAEHAAMVDQLERLYKRVSARIARAERVGPEPEGESVLDLKKRIRP